MIDALQPDGTCKLQEDGQKIDVVMRNAIYACVNWKKVSGPDGKDYPLHYERLDGMTTRDCYHIRYCTRYEFDEKDTYGERMVEVKEAEQAGTLS